MKLWTLALLALAAGCSESGISDLEDTFDTSDTDTDTDTDSDTDSDTDTDTDSDTDTDTDSDTDTDTDSDTDADTDSDTDADTDTGLTPNPCGEPVIAPYVTGQGLGGFQSVEGSGYQTTITVTLPCAANRIDATIIDPDFVGNVMIAYDTNNTELGRVSFIGDGMPGVLTTDARSIVANGIVKVELVPDPLDYVAYEIVLYY